MRIAWFAYGDLAQPTGGYVYDRLVVGGLRARGDAVDVVDPRGGERLSERVEVVVGDALCAPELGPLFEGAPASMVRVLLVHHFASWELDRPDADADTQAKTLPAIEARAVRASDRLVVTGLATRDRLVASSQIAQSVPQGDVEGRDGIV